MHASIKRGTGCVDLMVDRHVRSGRGAHLALIECSRDERRTLSYWQLMQASRRIAQEFDQQFGSGVTARRIAIVGGSTLETISAWLGAMRAGHLPFLVHPGLGADVYGALFADFAPDCIVRDRLASPANGRLLRFVDHVDDGESADSGDDADGFPESCPVPDMRPAFCLASSGSTGRAKICVHSHHAVAAFERNVTRTMWGMGADDIVLGTSGPYFSFGLQGIHPALTLGATSVLLPDWKRHEDFLSTIEQESVSVFLAVPTLYHLLMVRSSGLYRVDSLRLSLSAGERLPRVIRSRWSRFSRSIMLDTVGTTETFLPYLSETAGAGPGLRTIPAFEYEFARAESDVPESGAFTLRLTSDAMMLGQIGTKRAAQFEAASRTFEPRDVFAPEGDGWRFQSRQSERAKIGGQWISPQDLEEFLLTDERILKAAAMPVETAEGLTRLRAFIVLANSSGDPDRVIRDLTHRMREELKPNALRPDRIEVVDDLISTPTGKLRREALRPGLRGMHGYVPVMPTV
ncbi:AMP-binding protein [Paraburkholderia diazotrophica]|uniref:Acyl-coenzyme A synthetase/AMP-(Fatty) acid ligase n=1 Tax=Paraburkholderia diazotrophica TaxID=667676 RepID=A0A1H6WS81_9BURK|nr:AMP-binding protein [Paraburkholderia diazotrophica]SEJ19839.1 Acyl-coenzyme A synthetase/AMP-(fatty) acid ligase [Paraburkholderia diazotrophica]